MRFIKNFTYFVSGSNKSFSEYDNCYVNSVSEFYTSTGKRMMQVSLNEGELFVGQFCHEIFEHLIAKEGTRCKFFFYNYSRNGRMIACVPAIWGLEVLDLDTLDIV